MNLVVLQGTLSSDPRGRTLPSGDHLTTYEVTVPRDDGPADSVPVALLGRAPVLSAGHEVVVVGRVRRRFFRAGTATQSRTEVVAERVVPASHRRRVERALDRVREVLPGAG